MENNFFESKDSLKQTETIVEVITMNEEYKDSSQSVRFVTKHGMGAIYCENIEQKSVTLDCYPIDQQSLIEVAGKAQAISNYYQKIYFQKYGETMAETMAETIWLLGSIGVLS